MAKEQKITREWNVSPTIKALQFAKGSVRLSEIHPAHGTVPFLTINGLRPDDEANLGAIIDCAVALWNHPKVIHDYKRKSMKLILELNLPTMEDTLVGLLNSDLPAAEKILAIASFSAYRISMPVDELLNLIRESGWRLEALENDVIYSRNLETWLLPDFGCHINSQSLTFSAASSFGGDVYDDYLRDVACLSSQDTMNMAAKITPSIMSKIFDRRVLDNLRALRRPQIQSTTNRKLEEFLTYYVPYVDMQNISRYQNSGFLSFLLERYLGGFKSAFTEEQKTNPTVANGLLDTLITPDQKQELAALADDTSFRRSFVSGANSGFDTNLVYLLVGSLGVKKGQDLWRQLTKSPSSRRFSQAAMLKNAQVRELLTALSTYHDGMPTEWLVAMAGLESAKI